MVDHSQKWHDGTSSRNVEGSSNSEGIAAIVRKLDNLGAHLDKDCPLNEEVKSIEEAKYEKRPSLEELMNKHLEESIRRRAEMEEWIVQEKVASSKVLSCQLPPKEMNPGNFTLPCTIGSLNFYAMADLGANINVIPKSMFEHLKLAQLKKTDMLVEMVDMTKKSPTGIVENVLVKIDKFLFPSEFVVMDMLNIRNETMILRRPFLATIHAEIDVFNKEISLGIGEASSRVEKTNDLHNENNYCNQEQGRKDLVKDPRERSFDDYKWMFDLEVDQLADEYELGIGKKGHMLDDIWENCSRYKEMEFEGKQGCSIDTLQEFISCSHHSKRRTMLRGVFCFNSALSP
ncbi:putative reverse transcriptase domain-containing protein [Tanacetum coccineum]